LFLAAGMLLACGSSSYGQAVVAPQSAPAQPEAPAPSSSPDHLLLKVGLNATRVFRNGGYYGLLSRLPVSVGAEYSLSPKFTLYGQADLEVGLARRIYPDYTYPLVASGALSVGTRYYYNQAGRARHNRP